MSVVRTVLTALLLVNALPATASAQSSEPIRIIIPYPAGGVGDTTARLIAESMQATLKRSVIVESRPGAAGRRGDFPRLSAG